MAEPRCEVCATGQWCGRGECSEWTQFPEKDAPHHARCVRQDNGQYVCDPRCPDPHGGARCGYVPPGQGGQDA